MRLSNGWHCGFLACAGGALVLALGWPGVASYDIVFVYAQLRAGVVTDWHPPILARAWQGLEAAGLVGLWPLFVAQTALIWAGLGTLAAAAIRDGRARAAPWVLAVGLVPPVLSWTSVVWKDAQMAAAAIAGVGLWASARGVGQGSRRCLAGAGLALLGVATLLRQNALFATVPLALAWPAPRPARLGAGIALALLGLAAPVLNRAVFLAVPSHAERSQMIFDMAGATRMGGPVVPPGVDPGAWARVAHGGCVSAYGWDGFSQLARCRPIWAKVRRMPLGSAWSRGIAAQPVAYAAHRIAHLNATLRFLVPAGQPRSTGQSRSTPNPWGIGADPPAVRRLQKVERFLAATPVGWPFAWIGIAVTLLTATAGRPSATARTAHALLVSVLTTEASFAVVSVAADLRYHLWTFLATGVAGALLAAEPFDRRRMRIGLTTTATACVAAAVARLTLTPAWPSYL